MTLILGILSFFVILAILILVHELGHFSMAKLFGVRVNEFGLGFPPRLKMWRRGGTIYSLNAIPLGGFVRMLGENGEDLEPDAFGAKPPWQRLVVLMAGPGLNILLAIGIGWAAFVIGSARVSTTITSVAAGSPAAVVHLRASDRIISIDGVTVKDGDGLKAAIDQHLGEPTILVLRRGNRNITVAVTPRVHPPNNQGSVGVVLGEPIVGYGPADSMGRSLDQARGYILAVPQILTGLTQHNGSSVSGPIGIAHITTTVVQDEPTLGFGSILQLMAFLSLGLGVMNLLPIPALDGGRILFVLISWMRRRNLDPEVEGVIHLVGMMAMLMLIMVISYHDLSSWISGKG